MQNLKILVCPVHKTKLSAKNVCQTEDGNVKYASLVCSKCQSIVGTIRNGQVDFLRVEKGNTLLEDKVEICSPFEYRRLPWSDSSVKSHNMQKKDLGWNSEGYSGCLFTEDTSGWKIEIETEATDVALRFLSHSWSGSVDVCINNDERLNLNLYNEEDNNSSIKAYSICRNKLGKKLITIAPATPCASSNGSQVFFSGIDVCFSIASTEKRGENRGNGFPEMYNWALSALKSDDALLLDCGSGDRCFQDKRVIAFEYLPFELPDVFGDGHLLPFADDTFDVVFSQAVMEHMRDPYLAAKEIARVTKPSGLIYCESAFMQPLHAVPYHFFNTTPWGIESIFSASNISMQFVEWFGPLSSSLEWYLDSCGGGNLTALERVKLVKLLAKVDDSTSYNDLKPVASAVAYWGIKNGNSDFWSDSLSKPDRPTFVYTSFIQPTFAKKIKKFIKKYIKFLLR